jgi:hypothetical protein
MPPRYEGSTFHTRHIGLSFRIHEGSGMLDSYSGDLLKRLQHAKFAISRTPFT